MILHIGISCPIPLYVEAIELVHYPAGLIAKQIDQILWGILGQYRGGKAPLRLDGFEGLVTCLLSGKT